MAATDVVTLDGNCLRRSALLRAVAVAAGRASPVVLHGGGGEVRRRPSRRRRTSAQARAQGRLILVAEDDEINQKVILRQIELLGYAAEIADDGVEALAPVAQRRLRAAADRPAHARHGRLHAGRGYSPRGGPARHGVARTHADPRADRQCAARRSDARAGRRHGRVPDQAAAAPSAQGRADEMAAARGRGADARRGASAERGAGERRRSTSRC